MINYFSLRRRELKNDSDDEIIVLLFSKNRLKFTYLYAN